jgi:antitoxin CcdA
MMNEVRRPKLDGPFRQTRVALPASLLEQAASLGIDVSKAALAGVTTEVTRILAKQWATENSGAVDDWADYLQDNGQPFEDIQSRAI